MIDLKNIGQKQTDLLRDAYLNKKVAHSYLFVDPMQKKDLIQLIGWHVFLIVQEKISLMGRAIIAKEF